MPSRSLGLIYSLIVVALTAAGIRLVAFDNEGPSLEPRPDALEYALVAESIVDRGSLDIEFEGVPYPSRYPPGFPLVAAPYVALGGIESAWLAAFVNGILAAIAATLLGHLVAGSLGGLVAGLVVALSRNAAFSSTLAMSESTSTLCFTLAMLAAACLHWRSPSRPRRGIVIAGAIVTALAVLVRYTNLAFAAPLVLLALRRDTAGRRDVRLAALAVVIPLVGLVLLAARNAVVFGHPLHDGYRFWVPELYASGLTFSITYLWKPIADLFPTGNLAAYGRALAGLDPSLYGWPIALVALLGAIRAFRLRRSCPVAATLVAAMLVVAPAWIAFHLVYAWQDVRFLEPLLPLVAALAASGAAVVEAGVARIVKADLARMGLTIVVLASAFVPGLAAIVDELPSRDPVHAPVLPGMRSIVAELASRGPLDIVIGNIDPQIARQALPPGTRYIVTDLESAAKHYARILDHDLRGRDGRQATVPSLVRKGVVDQQVLAEVEAAIDAGRNAYLLHSWKHEGLPGEGIDLLRSRYEFDLCAGGPLKACTAEHIRRR